MNYFLPFATGWMQTLVQFFHMKGEGLSVDEMKSGDYKVQSGHDICPSII